MEGILLRNIPDKEAKMKKIVKVTLVTLILYLVCLSSCAYAEYVSTETQEARYIVVMVRGSGGVYTRTNLNTKTPAVVLDTVLGIVWRCQDLQDEKPLWIKTDLAKNQDQTLSDKKYTIKMLEWPSSELKIPAIVLDVEEGKAWTCHNLLDEDSAWIQKDLVKEIKEEGRKYR
jgi:hypothetical protein